jgi:flagellin-like protein
METINMMKFFRKHKKAVSPVIAVMLLVAVAVAAVGAYFIWFRSFQTQTQGAVQQQASGALGTEIQVLNISNDTSYYYVTLRNGSNVNATDINIAIAGFANEVTTVGTTLAKGSSASFKFNSSEIDIGRGTTRVFTISYDLATDPPSTGTTVHTYTDA